MSKEGKYLVTNEEILLLVNSWRSAKNDKERTRLGGQVVARLGFLVCSKIKSHKGSMFYNDLFQEGRIGIMRALQDFEPKRGRNFFLFATWHIQTRIRRFLVRETNRLETPVESIPNEETFELHDRIEELENSEHIMKALNFLPDNDRRVLIMRFGLNGEEPHTFQQIGNILGVSKQRAQQLENCALRRLRTNSELQNFNQGTDYE